MKPNPSDPAAWAALYAAGALPPEEAAAFEARLAAGDETCAAELRRLGSVVAALCGAVAPAEPRPTTRAALLDRIAAPDPPAPAAGSLPDLFIRHATSADWQDLGVPGVRVRVLCRDPQRRRLTYLVRMAPGSRIPPHPHPDVEECYVVEGDLQTFGSTFQAGDYIRVAAGTPHGPTRTEKGCVLLITSALEAF